MSHDQLDFAERIRAQGYRLTPQRQLILDVVCGVGGHATATEVWARVQERAPAINRATVYRTLAFLNDLRLLVSSEIGGRTVYEIAEATPHHHLVCRMCGRVEGLSDRHFRDLSEHLLVEHGFEAVLDHLAITGVCAECLAVQTLHGERELPRSPRRGGAGARGSIGERRKGRVGERERRS